MIAANGGDGGPAPVQVVEHQTTPDGQRYGSADSAERQTALALPKALQTGSLERARSLLDATPNLTLDYLVTTTPDLGELPAGFTGEARMLVAAKVGSTRLLDNAPIQISEN